MGVKFLQLQSEELESSSNNACGYLVGSVRGPHGSSYQSPEFKSHAARGAYSLKNDKKKSEYIITSNKCDDNISICRVCFQETSWRVC